VQPICKACGQPVWGHYLSAHGSTWHPEHFTCAACGRPIAGASFQLHEDAPYHLDCYRDRVAPRCAYCGKPLVGEYLVDQWGTQYCKEHQSQFPRCAYCGRLVPPRDREQGSDTVRCPVCRFTAIETAEAAKPIFSQLIRWVGSQGLRYNNLRLSMELCGRATLARHLREHSQTHSLGATMSTSYMQDGQMLQTEVSGVAVLHGLPSTLFQGVTVHELGHVWLIVQGVQGLPAWAEEGFCELLSYRYYKELNTPESRYHASAIENNPDPVYGEGFHRVQAIADSMGFPRFIATIQATKRLPTR
ncbi:MAG TPA: protein DA1, partial [Ktedonobacteraceae bacterium]|nr:protein DA1 [Ktedonobacteraceae bacterium]